MVFPLVFAWMEKTDHYISFGISAAHVRGFIEIAGAACQRPVHGGILTATGDRYDMFHLQGQVEHGFGAWQYSQRCPAHSATWV